MSQAQKVFGNLFSDPRNTSFRLSNFTTDAVSRLNNVDTEGLFKNATAAIVMAHTPFHNGLSIIDNSISEKKGRIKAVNVVRKTFGVSMEDSEGEIARTLGGRGTTNFIMFYPKGKTEYKKASKAQMPLLVKRVAELATENAAALGPVLTAQLQSYAVLWQSALAGETNAKSDLSDGRADRGPLRTNLEMALLTAIHLVAAKYPGDVAKCASFFDFSLLTKGSKKAAVVVDIPPAV